MKRAAVCVLVAGSLLASATILAALQVRATGSLGDYDLASTAAARRPLPPGLREVSGMATTPDGRILAHADERAVIAEIDPASGRVVKAFTLGTPAELGDFEGIATAHGRIYLVTSTGMIYRAEEGKADAPVEYQKFVSGAGSFCEIEGLAFDAVADRLLLPCKQVLRRKLRNRMLVLSVPLRTLRVEETPALSLPEQQLKRELGGAPSLTSVEVHPRTGSWLLLNSGPAAVIEVSADGKLLGVARLPAQLHPQPEGLAFTRDHTLLITNEARGGTAYLAVYPRRRS
jgi:uncharacterized protein YjiK